VTTERLPEARAALVRRGQLLSRLSLAYNSLEAIVSLIVGAMAGSISLIGFGADSVIEVSSSVAALWRLRADADLVRRTRVEAITLRLIGVLFLGLTLYILIDAVHFIGGRHQRKRCPGSSLLQRVW
jgi:predicted Co/Zn/Cd cation transporter (cation efflux family)